MEVSSYRSIFVLQSIQKVFKAILEDALHTELTGKEFFADFQLGFLSDRSTEQVLFYVDCVIDEMLERDMSVVAVFMDVEAIGFFLGFFNYQF